MHAKNTMNDRRWVGLAALALPTLLLAIETSVTYLALPHISKSLLANGSEQLWIVDIYGFMLASLLITMGALGDRIGRRKLLFIGASLFALASVAAAFAHTTGLLIVARLCMGVAGATLMPSTLALIHTMFTDAKERAMAIGLWMSCFMAGMIAGPLLGGLLLERYWWGSVFLVGMPVMVLLLAVGPFVIPEYGDKKALALDVPSIGLSLAALLPFVHGLKEVAYHGFTFPRLAALTVGIVMLIFFIRRQFRIPNPLFNVRLFATYTFSATIFIMFVTALFMGGTAFLLAQYLQLVQGLSPIHAGLWSIPQSLAMLGMSVLSPILPRTYNTPHLMAAGLAVAAAGFFILSQASNSLGLAVTGFTLATAGVAPTLVLGTGLIMGAVAATKAGSAAALSETANQLGVALGISVIGSLSAVFYRMQVDGMMPQTFSPSAFTRGLHVVALLGGGGLLLLAGVAGHLARSHIKAIEKEIV